MNGFELAQAYVTTLTGSPNTVCDFRIITIATLPNRLSI